MSDAATRGGVLLRVDGALRFVSAFVALRVSAMPRVTPVPGSPPELLGVALYEGVIVPVLALGAARESMIVCHHSGELVGLVGFEVVRVGAFATVSNEPGLVEYDGRPVEQLDLENVYVRVQSSVRSGAWGS
jgi:chemotaxis signal transduction protein